MYTNNKLCGVYAIVCYASGFIYIGSTAGRNGFQKRLQQHLYFLKKGKHHEGLLQKDYDRYGECAFDFRILEICTPSLSLELEQQWLNRMGVGARNKSYNTSPIAGNTLGYKHTEETKAGFRRRTTPLDVRAKISATKKGTKRTKESIEKTAAFHRGRKRTEESTLKLRLAASKASSVAAINNSKRWVVWSPEGEVFRVNNLAAFCREYGLNDGAMNGVAKKRLKSHKGWVCCLEDEIENIQRSRWLVVTPQGAQRFGGKLPPESKLSNIVVTNMHVFAKQHGLNVTTMSRVKPGKSTLHKGYLCKCIDLTNGGITSDPASFQDCPTGV